MHRQVSVPPPFTLQGTTTTIVVTQATMFTGSMLSLSALQPGDSAHIKGINRSDGSFLAYTVAATPADN
jgi:hypothetical protein